MIDLATLPKTNATNARRAPRLGFAGAGWIGLNRLEAIAADGHAEVAAVFDPVPAAVQRVVTRSPGAIVAADFRSLLALDLDGIVIATPSAMHTEQAVAALERGCAVFCQKPLGRTAEEARRVVEAARTADRLLHVDLSYRHHTGMRRIRELITRGELGEVYAVEAVFHNAYGPDKPWFYDARLSGGGCLLDLGIHLVDLALWCLDFPRVREATGHLLSRGLELARDGVAVEDFAAAQLRLSTGATVQLACSWKAPAGCDARIGLTFYGTEGGASFQNVAGSFYDFRADHLRPDRSHVVLVEPPDAWGGRAAVEWSRRLAIDPAFDRQVEHVVAVAETLDRLYGRVA